jgi:hypothetical protein
VHGHSREADTSKLDRSPLTASLIDNQRSVVGTRLLLAPEKPELIAVRRTAAARRITAGGGPTPKEAVLRSQMQSRATESRLQSLGISPATV